MTGPNPIIPGNPPPILQNNNTRTLLIIFILFDMALIAGLAYYFMLKPPTVPAEPAVTSGTVESTELLETKINELQRQNEELVSSMEQLSDTTESMPANIFTVEGVTAGDTVAGMEIVSLEPVNPDFSALSNENAVVKFIGPAMIDGKWKHHTEEEMLGEMVCLTPDEKSKTLLPAIKGNERDGNFCFRNEEAKTELGPPGASGTAKVLISDFVYYSYPSEGVNTATLLKVLKKS
jgi:hypothetical protein